MTKKRIAVTGATGFLGSHLCKRFIADGYHVRILVRDINKAREYEGQVEKIIVGDIADKEALNELMQGVECAVHLVSNFRIASGPPESYHQINVEGTKTALHAARAAGVKRFVHCSTIGVHGNVKETPATEDSPYNPGDLYQETKTEAEQFCLNKTKKEGMEIVVIRPTSLYGPGDMRMLKMFKMLAKRTFFTVGPCTENFHAVYIDDAVNGFIKVMDTPGISGQVFFIGGPEYVPLKEYINTAAKAVGVPPPWLHFPYWFFYGAAVVCESICVPLRIEPPLHRRRVRFFKNNRAFSIDKARKTLKYNPLINLEEGMKRTVAWYKKNGFL
ncbi:UDP-glucose 4-epimerase [hydrothermal vent metagenome]|uniref:UDP-glucose 4-epimerase n=1 Tax=hydrothermal vent metagenome TaxID=652676 RepID=A0A3B0ZLT8_9ZZZZ